MLFDFVLPPMSWSCELDTSQHVGCTTTASSRGQGCAWRVLLQSHMERSLQETFIVQELFWLKYLHCTYPASTCLQLASYLCSLCRKPTKKCFPSSFPLSFVHLTFPLHPSTPVSLLAVQIHLRGNIDMAKAILPHG